MSGTEALAAARADAHAAADAVADALSGLLAAALVADRDLEAQAGRYRAAVADLDAARDALAAAGGKS